MKAPTVLTCVSRCGQPIPEGADCRIVVSVAGTTPWYVRVRHAACKPPKQLRRSPTAGRPTYRQAP